MIEDDPQGQTGRMRFDTLASLSVADTLATLRHHAALIAILALAGAGAAYGASLLVAPSYVADAQIFVDPRSIQALVTQTSAPDANAEVLFVESQAQIISSESVLSRVVAAARLTEDPEFDGVAGHGVFSLATLGLGSPAAAPSPAIAARTALSALADRVTVRRPERTFVLDVAVKARTAEKAARLANAVAQAYFDEQAEAHSGMARRANKSLTDRLDELRERVRHSEERANAFRRDHGLVGTRTQLVSEQQLTDATTQIALARSRVIAAQARIDEIRHIGTAPDQPGASPEALGSPVVTLLRGQQADARRRLDKALGQLGPRHPEVEDARAEVEGLDHAVSAELTRIGQAARIELQRAKTAEAAQQKVVDQLSDQSSSASAAFVQLGEIEREVDVNKNLLNTFLSRARETSELEQMNTNTARLISTALPPNTRTFPPRSSVIALFGFLFGLGAGIGIAVLRGVSELAVPRPVEIDDTPEHVLEESEELVMDEEWGMEEEVPAVPQTQMDYGAGPALERARRMASRRG